MHKLIFTLGLLTLLAACGKDEPAVADVDTTPPEVTIQREGKALDKHDGKSVKPFAPVEMSYRIIGQPIVGQPVLIDIELSSNMGTAPVNLSYRLPDTSAMAFPAEQADRVSLAAPDEDRPMRHQLTVVPQREGRLYVNVSAEVETPDGTMSTVTAIPIQVGDAPRELRQNGRVVETEDGELIRSLPAEEQ